MIKSMAREIDNMVLEYVEYSRASDPMSHERSRQDNTGLREVKKDEEEIVMKRMERT